MNNVELAASFTGQLDSVKELFEQKFTYVNKNIDSLMIKVENHREMHNKLTYKTLRIVVIVVIMLLCVNIGKYAIIEKAFSAIF